ncbi:uncharacterized protein [Littorina saxatilis]|uniref:ShKT domain-containing protein n=1 Tax=Littorina saxatilis TaxID=31220 RepID=A0AAN9ANR6_9CAEN
MAKFVTVVCCLLVFLGNTDIKVLAAIGGQRLRSGDATETHSCYHVRGPPEELSDPNVMRPNGVDTTFYQKYTEAYGIPILGTSNITDDALKRACYTVRFLFAGHSGIRTMFYKLGGRFAIMSATEVTLDFPEFSTMASRWNSRARGLGGTWQKPITTGAEENLLCYKTDRYYSEDIFLHESAHAVDLIAAWAVITGFRQAVRDAFSHANDTGLWHNTYAATNAVEYWAEGVQTYFNVNARGSPGGNGVHNDIDTRRELEYYDPTLFQLIQEVFPCNNAYLKRCESTRAKENNQVLQMNCNTDGPGTVNGFIASLSSEDPMCQDSRPLDCLSWSLSGECKNNPSYMRGNCRASCKVCTPATSPVTTTASTARLSTLSATTSTSTPTTPTSTAATSTSTTTTSTQAATASTSTTTASNCTDRSRHCSWWSSRGECEKNPRYMRSNCKLSCGRCASTSAASTSTATTSTSTATPSDCKDDNRYCPWWSSVGECQRNPRYMLSNCKLSCGQCSRPSAA